MAPDDGLPVLRDPLMARRAILRALRRQPRTADALADALNMWPSQVGGALSALQGRGSIRKMATDRRGRWEAVPRTTITPPERQEGPR